MSEIKLTRAALAAVLRTEAADMLESDAIEIKTLKAACKMIFKQLTEQHEADTREITALKARVELLTRNNEVLRGYVERNK